MLNNFKRITKALKVIFYVLWNLYSSKNINS